MMLGVVQLGRKHNILQSDAPGESLPSYHRGRNFNCVRVGDLMTQRSCSTKIGICQPETIGLSA